MQKFSLIVWLFSPYCDTFLKVHNEKASTSCHFFFSSWVAGILLSGYLLSVSDSWFATQHRISSSYVFLWLKAIFFKKQNNEPWPFLCQHIWCMYNQRLRDTQGWSREGCTVFIVCSALHITHRIQLLWTYPRYMSYICIALTIGVVWFPTQARWSHLSLLVWCSEWIMTFQCVKTCVCLFIGVSHRVLCKD